MKIGIVTIFNGRNCGAYLQSYALKSYLEDKGNEVYNVEVVKKSEAKKYFYNYFTKRWLKGIRNTYNGIKFGREKYKIFNEAWKYFNISDANEKFDVLICGSDEIWNYANKAFNRSEFYGTNMEYRDKIAYAVSIGSLKANINTVPEYIKDGIKSFNAIFPRDEATKLYAEQFVDKDCSVVCDPTLLYPFENKDLVRCKDEFILKNKYILVYAYRYSQQEKEWVLKYAKNHNLKIVSATFYEEWCDHCVNCSPLEFIDVINSAEIVYTSSFHCGIFSMYRKKKMVVKGSRQKVSDLLKRIGLEDVLINESDSYEKFKKIANTDIDFDIVMKNVYNFRKASQKLLDEALEG